MSLETSPAYTSESKDYKKEGLPVTTGELQVLFDQPPAPEASYEAQVPAPLSLREKVTRRVADILHDASENLVYGSETRVQKAEQNTAYDSYAENIAATQSRENDEAKADRAEARAEKIEQARDAFRGIGRSANRLLVRANVELGYAKTVASETLGSAKLTYANAKEATVDSLLNAKDTVVDKAVDLKETVSDKTAEIKTAFAETAEATRISSETAKLKAELEVAIFMQDVRELVASGKEKIVNGANYVNDQKNALVMEFRQAKAEMTSRVSEKAAQIKEHFAERKAAAEARKTERQAAADAKSAERAKHREVIKRTAAIELQQRLEQRATNKSERAERSELKSRNRAVGRSALRTAFKVGLKTGKETYDTLKRN